MENTCTHFECKIENLYCETIERKITQYFNMGNPDNSSIPPEIQEEVAEECMLRRKKRERKDKLIKCFNIFR